MESSLRILHLEDDPVDSELVYEMLMAENLSPRIDRVTTLSALKDALEREAYGLILSDFSIPGLDPIEAFHLARQMQPEAPFIFVSGTIGEDLAIDTLKQGATDYVLKQRLERLAPAIRRALKEVDEQAQRREAQQALRDSEELLHLAQQVARVGTFEWNLQTNEHHWSPELEALYGLAPGDFVGTYEAWARQVHPDDLAEAELRVRAAFEHGAFEAEWRVIWPDGQVRWLAARAFLFKDDGGKPLRMVGVNIDITERKQMENALHEADQRKDEFLAMLSHELRNPLAPVRNAIQVLRLVGSKEPTAVRQQEIIERQVRHMARLVDDLLDVTRITRGRIELKKQPLDLAAVLDHAVEVATPLMEAKRHSFSLTLPPSGNLRVLGDPDRLAQVFGNLLTNAAKYTPEDGRIWMEAGRENDKVVVRVRDAGVGITPEILPRIFELFAQAEQGLARTQGGLGIGLTMVKRLVEMHGGAVEAHSDGPSRGSEFTVRLPVLNELEQAPI